MNQILLVEDQEDLRFMICQYLVSNGYDVWEAKNGKEALENIDERRVDLIITDVMMPDMNGYELTKDIRSVNASVPILMITAKETIDDKELGFLSGADDYMVKPIILKELTLRVNALLKRAQINISKTISTGDIVLDYEGFTATVKGKDVALSKKEFLLVFKLLSKPNQIFTKIQLMDDIWGYDSESDENTVKVHISRVREKFKDCDDFEIVTIKGLGYKAVIHE